MSCIPVLIHPMLQHKIATEQMIGKLLDFVEVFFLVDYSRSNLFLHSHVNLSIRIINFRTHSTIS